MNKRISALILALVTAMSVSCGSSGELAETTAAPDTTSASEPEKDKNLLDKLADADYEGRTVTFGVSTASEPDILAEELNGEVTNDAVWSRNNKIEEKFNIEIESVVIEQNVYNWYPKLTTIVLAGDDVYDIVGHYAYDLSKAVSAGIYQDWNTVANLELDNPWWAQEINERATFNGKLYGLSGYIGMSIMQYSQAMFYNQRHVEDYGTKPETLYELVYDGKWTFEAFENIVKNMYVDLNNNGERDDKDFYGYCCCSGTTFDYWQDAFDIPITSKNKDGSISVDLLNDKRVSALERINTFLTTVDGAKYNLGDSAESSWTWYDQYNFYVGRQAFSGGPFLGAFEYYRNMEDTYGVLPFPKWDEAQEGYYAPLNDRYTVWGIPMTVKDTAFVGLVAEAMARETYENVYPAFYDVALKGKFSTDEHYAEMVDLVMSGMRFDVANMFGGYMANAPYIFRYLLQEESTDLASKYAEIKGELDEGLKSFNTFYAD